VIFELADEIGLKIQRAEAEASESIRMFHELQTEQEQNRDRRVMLRQALEELPLAHSRAALDDRRERMRELSHRQQEFRRELQRLKGRAPQIVEEMRQLAPRRNGPDGSWHHHDVHRAPWSNVLELLWSQRGHCIASENGSRRRLRRH
jgi:DNA repair exonuclease SbcCD ATPase subunit